MVRNGSQVKWKWGNGEASGKVEETFTHEGTNTIKGNEISRKGEEGNKVLFIKQEDGSEVLKLKSEVEKA